MKANLVLISSLILTFSLIPCNATIQSNPRVDVEKTPEDDAFTKVGEIKDNVRSTMAFIDKSEKTEKYADVLGRLKGCKMGYNSTKPGLGFHRAKLHTREGRADVIEMLRLMSDEVTYDCGWQILTHHPPVVKQLADRVDNFADKVSTTVDILRSIDQ